MYAYLKPQPETVQSELVVIQYPGIIKNLDRALETLGGLTKVSQVCIGSEFQIIFVPLSILAREVFLSDRVLSSEFLTILNYTFNLDFLRS